ADVLKFDIQDLLDYGVDIAEPVIAESTAGTPATNFLGKKKDLVAVATGEVIPMAQVNDAVFSQKMMGDVFAVKPLEREMV
ncbi:PTS glucose transporter subunit IIA, partial [Enterococcus faecalis]|uniref:PTS glucose transporter subunit IIA n=1 Tax=Enterococcus faecalis TaxID=1351 RepID=UPI003D6AEDBC